MKAHNLEFVLRRFNTAVHLQAITCNDGHVVDVPGAPQALTAKSLQHSSEGVVRAASVILRSLHLTVASGHEVLRKIEYLLS